MLSFGGDANSITNCVMNHLFKYSKYNEGKCVKYTLCNVILCLLIDSMIPPRKIHLCIKRG